MWWKGWPAWLKGGIILSLFAEFVLVLAPILALGCMFGGPLCDNPFTSIIQSQFAWTILIVSFIIGALIGKFVGSIPTSKSHTSVVDNP